MFNKTLFVAILFATCGYMLFFYKIRDLNDIGENIQSFLMKLKSKYLEIINSQNILSKVKLKDSPSLKLFTQEELSQYNGENNGNIYLSIMGKVFDVTKGKKYYGKGESYHGFAGKDASKAFITGDFTSSGLTDDISNLTSSDLGDLRDWALMYEKDYIYKGKLIGRFFDNNGEPTPFMQSLVKKLAMLDVEKAQKDTYTVRYPPCNVEWTQEKGSRVWCSKQSGGIERSWIGVPRKYYQPGISNYRCACINPNEKNLEGKFLLYEQCQADSTSCFVKQ